MPESRTRHKHHSHHPQYNSPHTTIKARRSAAVVLATIAAILGFAVAYFSQGADILWMVIGAVSGAIIGYIVGRNMDKSFASNK